MAASSMALASTEAKRIADNETAKALAAFCKQSEMSAFMTQLNPEQKDPEVRSCQRGMVIKLSCLKCGLLKGELC